MSHETRNSKLETIVFFAAMPFELKPLLKEVHVEHQRKEKGILFYRASYRSLSLLLVQTGVGKKKAHYSAQQLLKITRPALAVSMGLCGALVPSLKVGQSILSHHFLDLSTKEQFRSDSGAMISSKEASFLDYVKGSLVTAKTILGPKEKTEVLSQYPEMVGCDMESSYLASIFIKEKIPFCALRTVSDTLDAVLPAPNFFKEKTGWGKAKALPLLQIYPLLRLGWHSRVAAKKNTKEILKLLTFFVDTKTIRT